MLERLKDILFHKKPYLVTYGLKLTDGSKHLFKEIVRANLESTACYIIMNRLRLLTYRIISIEQLLVKGVD